MTQKEKTKWNNRHFQICLAIIARTETDLYGHTKALKCDEVISKADRMVQLLQERERRVSEIVEKSPSK